MLRVLYLLLGLTCLISSVHAVTDDMVVIRSNSSKLMRGQLLNSHMPINLPAKAEITVVFGSGGVVTMTGPYQGTLADPIPNGSNDTDLLTTLAKVARDEEAFHLRTAPKEQPQDIGFVDVDSNNSRYYCVSTTNRVVFWRPEGENNAASTLLIKHKASGQQEKVVWPAHRNTVTWPSNLPVVYGDTYTLEINSLRGRSNFKKLVLYQLPDNLPTKSHKVVWMVGKGCVAQANMLLANLR